MPNQSRSCEITSASRRGYCKIAAAHVHLTNGVQPVRRVNVADALAHVARKRGGADHPAAAHENALDGSQGILVQMAGASGIPVQRQEGRLQSGSSGTGRGRGSRA